MEQEGARSRRRFYGIAEIADALGVDRQLVTVWRRRQSRDMPRPDAELAAGPLWLGTTIEPWIEQARERLEREAAATRAAHSLTPSLARQAARRAFRLAALLLEEPPRPQPLRQAMLALAELRPRLEQAAVGGDAARRGARDLALLSQEAAAVAASLDRPPPDRSTGELLDDLLARCLEAMPQVARMLLRPDPTAGDR